MARLRSRVAGVAAALVALPLAVARQPRPRSTPDYTITLDPKAEARPSMTPCTASSSRTSTTRPTAASTPSSCATARSSSTPPTPRLQRPDRLADRRQRGRHRHLVNDAQRLNERNRNYLKLAAPAGGPRRHQRRVQHRVRGPEGEHYDFSVWARADGRRTPLTVALRPPTAPRWPRRSRSPSRTTPGPSTPARCGPPPPATPAGSPSAERHRDAAPRHGVAVPAGHLQEPAQRPARATWPRRSPR